MMTILYTEGGQCFVGVNYDTASFTQAELLTTCLRDGFDEVLALDPEPPAAKRPAKRAPKAPAKRAAKRPATRATPRTTRTVRTP
jgi:diacylglycerol O-acyltransferase / wax synthase